MSTTAGSSGRRAPAIDRRRSGGPARAFAGTRRGVLAALLLLLLLPVSASAFPSAAGGRVSRELLAHGADQRDVCFADAAHGWAVGDGGVILATGDGGATWVTQRTGTDADLYGVAFADAAHGWAVGDSGTTLRTTNGGATWARETSGTSSWLRGVTFRDTMHGWAVGSGGVILATADGGVTWAGQRAHDGQFLRGVAFTDATHGAVVGWDGVILTTADAGAHWRARLSGTTKQLESISFGDATHGCTVGGEGTLLATADGGATWAPQGSGTTRYLQAVAFVGASNGWAVGDGGKVVATTDGGVTWHEQNSATSADLSAVAFCDATHGWAVGGDGAVDKTTDGGATWTPGTSGVPSIVGDITPPTTAFMGIGGFWHNDAVHITLTAHDNAGGSGPSGGLASTEYRLDGGPWVTGTHVTIGAPSDHSNDGRHVLTARSTDAIGNVALAKSRALVIDTRGPTIHARSVTGAAGRAVVLRFRVDDILGRMALGVRLVVRNAHGQVLARVLGSCRMWQWQAVQWVPPVAGTYHYSITARDQAGNRETAPGRARVVAR